MTKSYESLPLIVKLLLQLFFGGIIALIYRVVKYTETKNVVTLVAGLLCLTGVVAVVFWICDFVTELLSGKITVLAD